MDFTIDGVIALLTLTSLEIVLGIDNIVFIAILSGRLHPEQQKKARVVGLALAMISRIALLLTVVWITHLTQPLFSLLGRPFSGRDLILLGGGLFLLAKSTFEIHHHTEGDGHETYVEGRKYKSFGSVVFQIMLIDVVFSLDSVITAVGMAQNVAVMITAIIIAVLVMFFFAGTVSNFVAQHPTIKMLALAFLLLIGVMLLLEGLGGHIDRGYIYFAMAFSLSVELLNLRAHKRRRAHPVPAAPPHG